MGCYQFNHVHDVTLRAKCVSLGHCAFVLSYSNKTGLLERTHPVRYWSLHENVT